MWKISTPKEILQTQVLGQTWKILKSKEMCIPVFVSRVDAVLACWTIPFSRKRFAFAFAPWLMVMNDKNTKITPVLTITGVLDYITVLDFWPSQPCNFV